MKTKILSGVAIFLLILTMVNTCKVSNLSSELSAVRDTTLRQDSSLIQLENERGKILSFHIRLLARFSQLELLANHYVYNMSPEEAKKESEDAMYESFAVLYGEDVAKKVRILVEEKESEENNTEKPNVREKKWVEIYRHKGIRSYNTDLLNFGDGKKRIRYDYKTGVDGGVFLLEIIPEGCQPGLSIELTLSKTEKGESSLSHYSAGNYYLRIANLLGEHCEFVIEEYR